MKKLLKVLPILVLVSIFTFNTNDKVENKEQKSLESKPTIQYMQEPGGGGL